MSIPVEDLHRTRGTEVAPEMTIRRFVSAAQHNQKDVLLEIGSQKLAQLLLILLHVSAHFEVSQISSSAQQRCQPAGSRIRRETVQR
jgi:hypothetical protein